jgi:hypothetical protein
VPPRSGLHIHTVGSRGDIIDESDHMRDVYVMASGDWVLVRPDGYVGAIISSGQMGELKTYLREVGLHQGSASSKNGAHF